eukprot:5430267-Amphidinium_carterae.1
MGRPAVTTLPVQLSVQCPPAVDSGRGSHHHLYKETSSSTHVVRLFWYAVTVVTTHPKQVPKYHPGVPLLTQVVERRRLARDPGVAAAASGKRRMFL